MLKGIVIVSAGVMQLPAIRKAKELGYFVIATDRNPDAIGFKYCDLSVVIDSKDVNGHLEFVKKHKLDYNIRGAFAGSDVAVTVAAINEFLDVPAVSIESAEKSNNKWLMKQSWMKDNVATPASIHVTNLTEAEEALNRTGLPCMVKSVDNAASRGSKMINEATELKEAFENACKYSRTGTALIEQYITGKEYSVESIFINGKIHIVSIAERHFGFLPYHIETSHIDPIIVSNEEFEEIKQLVGDAAASLGINTGPAKSDLIRDQNGFKILEMPARLSGGFHSQFTTPLSTGKDPIKAVLQIAVGDDVSMEYLTPKYNQYSMCAGLFPEPGTIKYIEGLDDAKSLTSVREIICLKGPGDIIEDYVDNGKRFFWIILVANSREELIQEFEKAKSLIKFNIEK